MTQYSQRRKLSDGKSDTFSAALLKKFDATIFLLYRWFKYNKAV